MLLIVEEKKVRPGFSEVLKDAKVAVGGGQVEGCAVLQICIDNNGVFITSQESIALVQSCKIRFT